MKNQRTHHKNKKHAHRKPFSERFRKPLWLLAATVVIISCGALTFISSSLTNTKVDSLKHSQSQHLTTPSPISSTTNSNSKPGNQSAKNTLTSPPSKEETDNKSADHTPPFFEQEAKARIAQVAERFAAKSQYPSFSQPIENRVALNKYLPNRSFAIDRPLDPEKQSGVNVELSTEKLRYFKGETVNAVVKLTGLQKGAWLTVQGDIRHNKNILLTSEAVEIGPQHFHIRFTDLDALPQTALNQFRVVASITVDSETYEVGTPITVQTSIATIESAGLSNVVEEFLNIPLHISTDAFGYYELGANLYSATSGDPLLHLSVQDFIDENSSVLTLRAHIAALQSKKDEGPYELRDFLLRRMPASPDFTEAFGYSTHTAFTIPKHSFAEYADVGYTDIDTQERLDLLREIGQE
ncbi:hypothetical protein TDB9533_03487 [Thalassocella blandensis]|nr:hypothetical protein TDB9533_03487 [Thalassocella blandensis]